MNGVSKKYENGHSLLDYICSCGRKSKITFFHFLNGKRCKKCGIEKMTGKNNPKYNPNLTDEERINKRKYLKYSNWRTKVFKRDDYTCQKCFQRGKILNAHHILNYSSNKKLRIDENNGITLCKNCHIEFHKKYGNKNNTQKQIDEFLNLVIFI